MAMRRTSSTLIINPSMAIPAVGFVRGLAGAPECAHAQTKTIAQQVIRDAEASAASARNHDVTRAVFHACAATALRLLRRVWRMPGSVATMRCDVANLIPPIYEGRRQLCLGPLHVYALRCY